MSGACPVRRGRFASLFAPRSLACRLLSRSVMMEGMDTALAMAEFEATWLEVSYQDGRASVAEVQRAIRRVDELRRVAAALARAYATGNGLTWSVRRAVAPAGH